MKINYSKRFNEQQTILTLENGLRVVIVHKPGYKSNSAVFGTPFGAKNLSQSVGKKQQTYNAGIAHFLEHKLFEQEEEDILSVFTNLGASANAFTSYNETVYYFNNVNDIEKPLNVLLDFVQSLSITKESVDKEKGIIIEELKMYQQIPAFQLSMELFKSMFHVHPLKEDIAGSEESVNAISKEELELAYQTNYHPSQMVLSIVTHYPVDEIIRLIKINQSKKSFEPLQAVDTDIIEEKSSVVKENVTLKMNVSTPKVAIGFKQHKQFIDYGEILRNNLLTRFLLDMTFSKLNPQYQEWLDNGTINDFFNYQADYGFDYGYIQFVGETENTDEFVNFIEFQMQNLQVDETLLNQLIRRTIGENINDMEDFETLAIDGLRSEFLGVDYFEIVTMAESFTVDELIEVKESITLKNKAVVVIDNK